MMAAATNTQNSHKPVLVVGLGLTGWSVIRYLYARGEAMVVTDTRDNPPFLNQLHASYPEVPFVANLPNNNFEGYREIVASPGLVVAADHAIGDIELFAREAKAPIIGVTGSNGKSTVTTLVGKMLNNAGYTALVGGNIGTPALDLLELPVPDFYVLELSSFQLETTVSLSPCAAVVLNVSEDHMDRYSNLQQYASTKFRVYTHASCSVINRDDALVREYKKTNGGISFGLDQGASGQFGIVEDEGEEYFAVGQKKLAPTTDLSLQGKQNISNVLAAMALIDCAGLELSTAMIEAAMQYQGLPHRCELVGSWDGVKWVNDSKGTNVGATLAAINGAEKPVILIAGGQGKGADFLPLKHAVAKSVKAVVLLGEDALKIAGAIEVGEKARIAESLRQAIELAADQSEAGDTVLFSPACASFDMFKSYEHRGEEFRRLVKERHDAE